MTESDSNLFIHLTVSGDSPSPATSSSSYALNHDNADANKPPRGKWQLPEINEKECLDFLSRLIQIKSYTKTAGELEATQFMADAMKEIGLESDVFPFDSGTRQNAIGRWHGTGTTTDSSSSVDSTSSSPDAAETGKAKTLLFNGHLDTNPVSAGWTIDPWAGYYDDEFIYGIGVSNMKSGCAAYYCAVKALKDSGWTPRGDVVLTFVVGELQGGVGTVAIINDGLSAAIQGPLPDYFINCEPSDIRAITMHAESLIFELTLVGITRHMSAREEAVDAILAACKLIPRLTAMKFSNAPSEEHRRINRCHIGVVHGALGPDLDEWRPPQVADYVKIQGSARYAPGQTQEGDADDYGDYIQNGTKRPFQGLRYTLKPVDYPTMPAFQVSRDATIVQSLNKAYSQVRGPGETQPTGALPPSCFYGSDAGHLYKRLGMQGIVCGPGGRYNTRPDEKVDIVDYIDAVKMFVRVIVDICG
ncbi:Zn-dependent exopeptidase [Xylona heveae TC161]|uniref:Zn-dependent exopeptidase n=1 Tax=Xylona heveae (strain CBS 132557 / TC161) TaxID=1328760 RepID=A0A165JSH9_XYLHT|nr:Zn-dependent exopeptidase [Xylona heveae TC161]KZF26570.1 Zn-dependent exopeptidase [Xylona heveae TC161]